jgi:hypothetical protein
MYTRLLLLFSLIALRPISAVQAQVAAPTQGGEASVIRVTGTTMELEFGTSGSGQGRVVAMAPTPTGSPVPLMAANSQFYSGSTTYGRGNALGSGYVVYSGTGHSAIVTGLRPGTYYYITNAEYNVSGPNIAYNTFGSSVSTSTANVLQSPLPVELTSFAGRVGSRGAAVLQWNTASEHQSAYFAIERSDDGNTFAETARVEAAGTSTQSRAYQWEDPQRLTKLTYYRLRQADHDGTVHYSPMVALKPALGIVKQIEVYPNPSGGQEVQISLQGFEGEKIALHLIDITGREVWSRALTSAPTAQHFVPLSLPVGLATGVYTLTLSGSNALQQKRLIISN